MKEVPHGTYKDQIQNFGCEFVNYGNLYLLVTNKCLLQVSYKTKIKLKSMFGVEQNYNVYCFLSISIN